MNSLSHQGPARLRFHTASVDTGRGMSIAEVPSSGDGAEGTGVQEMRERMRNLGGRLEVTSGSIGTTLRAVLPFVPRRAETSQ